MATKKIAKTRGAAAAQRRSERLKQLHTGLRARLTFTPLVSLGLMHTAFDALLRRGGIVVVDGAEHDDEGNGVERLHYRVDLNEYADSVAALVPGDVYLDFEEPMDCAPPEHTVISVLATDAASLERVSVALAEELATRGCTRVAT